MKRLVLAFILIAGLAGGVVCQPLPTIADIDLAAFPVEPERGGAIAGRDLYVALTGADANPGTREAPFRRIARALEAARDGDRIRIFGGHYEEGPEDEYRGLVIEQSDLILENVEGETVTIVPASAAHWLGLELSGDRIAVRGVRLEGFSTSIALGNHAGTQRDIVLAEIEVVAPPQGDSDGIANYADLRGQGIPASDGVLLRDVAVRGASVVGISCNGGPCLNWRLTDVRVFNAPGVENSGADAIAVEEGRHFLLENVEAAGATADGIDLKADRVAILNAYVHDVGRNGIKLWRGGDVVNTLVHHTGADASIVFEQGSRYRLLNTIVAYHNWRLGSSYAMTVGYVDFELGISSSGEVEIANCVFYRNAGGLFFAPGFQLSIFNTLFAEIDNGEAIAEADSRTAGERVGVLTADDPVLFERHGLGSGNLLGDDPRFADPSGGDFSFGADSPLADGGVVRAPFPEWDRSGRPRLAGAAPDIGPDEMGSVPFDDTAVEAASWGRIKSGFAAPIRPR